MNNLLNKIGLVTGLTLAAGVYSGCENTPQAIRQQEELEKRMAGVLLGGALINRGIAVDNAGVVAVGQGVINGSLQQPPQTTVIVNGMPAQPVPVNYPPQIHVAQQNTAKVFVSQGWTDSNNDGIINYPREFTNLGNARFTINETIHGVIYGEKNPTYNVRGVVKDAITNTIIAQTNPIIMNPSTMQSWVLPSATPGIYTFTVMDHNNTPFGETLFEIVK
jgi:hypothetical protein